MNKEEFKKLAYEMVDWVAEYMEGNYDYPVLPSTQPGEVLGQLPKQAPLEGEPGQALFDDFKYLIVPNLTHWGNNGFYAYFPSNKSYPSILGEILAAGLDVNPFSWSTSPAATELEQRVMEWLRDMIGLPASWSGVTQDSASVSTLCAVLSARERALDVNHDGFPQDKSLKAYISEHGHSSIVKAIRISGIGEANTRFISVLGKDAEKKSFEDEFSINPDELERAIIADIEAGHIPALVVVTVGTTSTTTIDDVETVANKLEAINQKYGTNIWLHVDAALAGTAAIVPEMKWLMKGVDKADSFVFNPHKWMFTNVDCSAYFCKDDHYLQKALAIEPEYLKMKHDGQVNNYRDWGIALGRRFRALKLWFVMRSFGVNGLIEKLRLHLEITQAFAKKLADHDDLELVVKPQINTVCFRYKDSCDASKKLMDDMNETGKVFLTHTKLNDKYVIRVAFGQLNQSMQDVEDLWGLILSCMTESTVAA